MPALPNTPLPSDSPDTVQVSVRQTKDVSADAADLSVTVRGASLLTGQMALHKAREVAALVADLAGVGVEQDSVYLEGVHADTATGTLVKASGASYRLRVHVAPLEKLADVLGVITSQKNAALNGIAWRYPEDAAEREAWLAACIAEANAKAARIAAALGVRLLGVRLFTENYHDPEAYRADTIGISNAMRRARVSPEELGLEVSHTTTAMLQVDVQYRVSGFDA